MIFETKSTPRKSNTIQLTQNQFILTRINPKILIKIFHNIIIVKISNILYFLVKPTCKSKGILIFSLHLFTIFDELWWFSSMNNHAPQEWCLFAPWESKKVISHEACENDQVKKGICPCVQEHTNVYSQRLWIFRIKSTMRQFQKLSLLSNATHTHVSCLVGKIKKA